MGSDVVINRAGLVATVGAQRYALVPGELAPLLHVYALPAWRMVGVAAAHSCGFVVEAHRAAVEAIQRAWWADDRAAARGGEG